MSSDAFVETSLTTSPSDFSAVFPFSVIAATSEFLQKLCEHECADERSDHRQLRMRVLRRGSLVGRPGRLAGRSVGGCCGFAGFHHSGGSSSKTLTQIAVAKRVVAIVASAPS